MPTGNGQSSELDLTAAEAQAPRSVAPRAVSAIDATAERSAKQTRGKRAKGSKGRGKGSRPALLPPSDQELGAMLGSALYHLGAAYSGLKLHSVGALDDLPGYIVVVLPPEARVCPKCQEWRVGGEMTGKVCGLCQAGEKGGE